MDFFKMLLIKTGDDAGDKTHGETRLHRVKCGGGGLVPIKCRRGCFEDHFFNKLKSQHGAKLSGQGKKGSRQKHPPSSTGGFAGSTGPSMAGARNWGPPGACGTPPRYPPVEFGPPGQGSAPQLPHRRPSAVLSQETCL